MSSNRSRKKHLSCNIPPLPPDVAGDDGAPTDEKEGGEGAAAVPAPSLSTPPPKKASPTEGAQLNRFQTLAERGSHCAAAGQLRRKGDVVSPGPEGNVPGDASSNRHSSSKAVPQRFDYFLIIDFEATCDQGAYDWPHEIIEFPVVAIDTRTCKVVAEFHSFVRPVRNPVLTDFCTELTGITQANVADAPLLQTVIRQFEAWFAATFPDPSRCIIATDGPWDMRDFMFKHSVLRDGVDFPPFFYRWINLRKTYADFFKIKPIGVGQMLTRLGLNFEGRQHSGIDDARNIARIAVGLIQRGCRLSSVSSLERGGELDKFAEMARAIEAA